MNEKDLVREIAITVIVGLTGACAAAESIPSASYLLDKYTQALDSTKSFIDHYEIATDFQPAIPQIRGLMI